MCKGLPRWFSVKETACQCRRCRRHEFNPRVRKIPLEEEMAAHFGIVAWKIPWTEEPGRRQPTDGVVESWTQQSNRVHTSVQNRTAFPDHKGHYASHSVHKHGKALGTPIFDGCEGIEPGVPEICDNGFSQASLLTDTCGLKLCLLPKSCYYCEISRPWKWLIHILGLLNGVWGPLNIKLFGLERAHLFSCSVMSDSLQPKNL